MKYPEDLPKEYRPIGAWAYFGYSILFSIPLVGLILLIVFSFDNTNINLRNFARSHFCSLLICAIIFFIFFMIFGISMFTTGIFAEVFSKLS